MPSIKGNKKITVQPGTLNMAYRIHSDTCSSTDSNDAFIPYGLTISSVVVTVKTEAGVVDTQLLTSTIVVSPNIDIKLSYPTTNGAGRYFLSFVVTFDDGSKEEFDMNRVYVEDL